jgi:hypothetical protein
MAITKMRFSRDCAVISRVTYSRRQQPKQVQVWALFLDVMWAVPGEGLSQGVRCQPGELREFGESDVDVVEHVMNTASARFRDEQPPISAYTTW